MKIKVGKLVLGDGYISIQTMLKNSIHEISKNIQKIEKLAGMGCDMIRIAVPDQESISSLKKIIHNSVLPVVADIHFDHRLAIQAVEAGVHKIRINPGNIGNESKVKEVIACVKEHQIPVRIGINGGSLPLHLIEQYPDNRLQVMLESAKEEIRFFEKYNYDQLVLSFKSSSVTETLAINRIAKKEFGYPLHIGITEAGDLLDGTIKNAVGIGILLSEGIGDTIRVSLTAGEYDEVATAKHILESLHYRIPKFDIISCPTCGRTSAPVIQIVQDLKTKIIENKLNTTIKIAVMGCTVNGPGEAKEADFGVACGPIQSVLFKNGKKLKVIKNTAILDELLMMVSDYYDDNES